MQTSPIPTEKARLLRLLRKTASVYLLMQCSFDPLGETAIAAALEMDRQTVRNHLRSIQVIGLVDRLAPRQGWILTAEGRLLLSAFTPSPSPGGRGRCLHPTPAFDIIQVRNIKNISLTEIEPIPMNQQPRTIKQVIEPQLVIEGAGVLLRRSFGPNRANPFDPFLLFDHFAFNDPLEGPIKGFPTHPHRGIETVTYMLEGNVRHRDSLGNTGIIGPGDVQWMTSGRGILHEEMPRRGPSGLVNGFQLWVNLPAAQKMSPPRYQEVTADSIPCVEQDGVQVRVVAGEYGGIRGPVTEIAAQPLYMDITLDPGLEFNLPVPAEHTAVAYIFEGEGLFGVDGSGQGEYIQAVHMAVFGDGDHLRVQAGSSASLRFMLMAGAPFKEPIFPYGPFVMNTQEEIMQTLAELRNGTFIQN